MRGVRCPAARLLRRRPALVLLVCGGWLSATARTSIWPPLRDDPRRPSRRPGSAGGCATTCCPACSAGGRLRAGARASASPLGVADRLLPPAARLRSSRSWSSSGPSRRRSWSRSSSLFAGIGDTMKILVIVSGCVWPILLNTVEGVRAVDEVLRRHGRVLRHQRRRTRCGTSSCARPARRSSTGARQALSIGIILMVISEMFAASSGLGFTIVQFQRSFAIPEMWSGILLLGLHRLPAVRALPARRAPGAGLVPRPARRQPRSLSMAYRADAATHDGRGRRARRPRPAQGLRRARAARSRRSATSPSPSTRGELVCLVGPSGRRQDHPAALHRRPARRRPPASRASRASRSPGRRRAWRSSSRSTGAASSRG